MRTDGVFSIHQVDIQTPYNRQWKLIPFGDIHRDSPGVSEDKWREFLDYAKAQENALFLGMGDYMDGYSTSERMIVYHRDLHESTRKRDEEEGRRRVLKLAKELAFMRGKCIGLLGGNHFQQYADGTTSDMLLARELGTTYLGACAAIRLRFKPRRSRKTAVVDVFAHHGKGGGQTAGGKMNAVEKLSNLCDADIFLMGDNHARGVLPLGNRLRLDNDSNEGLRLRSRSSWIGRTGSFLRGYVPGQSSYVVDGAMCPANLGWISFNLMPRRDHRGGGDKVTVLIGAEQ